MSFIKVPHIDSSGQVTDSVLNTDYIIRISVAPRGDTVIEVEGSTYGTWTSLTPVEIYNLITESTEK